MKVQNILLIDDDPDVLTALELLLEEQGETVYTFTKPADAVDFLKKKTAQVCFLDMNFTKGKTDGAEGLESLNLLKQFCPEMEVIVITAYADIALAVKAVKLGAFDFILKPWENEKLLAQLAAALKLSKVNGELSRIKEVQNLERKQFAQEVITESPQMRRILESVDKMAKTDASIHITGENGTGKELIARRLHMNSDVAAGNFVSVDLGAISESLFESELFGHAKGAFTGAHRDKLGRFELAHQGSLFLDEISNLSMTMQAKLLRVLEQNEVVRVGENVVRSVDVRLISASNKNLRQMVSEQSFREDLMYRLNTFEVYLPPLRERKEDIPLLADYYLQKLKKKYDFSKLDLSKRNIQKLQNYAWPGNIRELRNSIERAVVLSEGKRLNFDDLYVNEVRMVSSQSNMNVNEAEKQLIQKAILKCNGNITKAAKELGLKRTALYRRLEKYGLK